MKSKAFLAVAFIAASALAVAGWMHFKQRPQSETAGPNTARVQASEPQDASQPLHRVPELPAALREYITTTPPIPEASPAAAPSPAAPTRKISAAAPQSQDRPVPIPAKKSKPPLQDPTARIAMSLVGADPDAEAYWLEAIFDSSLSDGEREDLMEDLNEEGLSDHKRPGPDDFPLIVNRLALILEIAPEADDFMLRHLGEAYKDLLNLAAITQGEGSPVR
ncbi:MAG TPA: hypothetical protein VFD27_10350 [Chthoniobacteraceae bacterium]|nr:hypothetical protein [Chthoniobacteraceae bacterium]